MRFADKLRELGFASYDDYLLGEHWQRFKSEYARSAMPQGCMACGNRTRDLHHVTYKRLGAERLKDVLPLCRVHHEQVHRLLKDAGKFVEDTLWAIGKIGPKRVKVKKPKEKKKQQRSTKRPALPAAKCIGCPNFCKTGRKWCGRCARNNRPMPAPVEVKKPETRQPRLPPSMMDAALVIQQFQYSLRGLMGANPQAIKAKKVEEHRLREKNRRARKLLKE
jgi:hypothetical protein